MTLSRLALISEGLNFTRNEPLGNTGFHMLKLFKVVRAENAARVFTDLSYTAASEPFRFDFNQHRTIWFDVCYELGSMEVQREHGPTQDPMGFLESRVHALVSRAQFDFVVDDSREVSWRGTLLVPCIPGETTARYDGA